MTNETNEDGYNLCVMCGKATPYKETDRIDGNPHYIEGAGQLCSDCWNDTYNGGKK